jgi:DNA-binding winged helix-turn-helix (wHTH) protein/TolB-like protein/tetratricopeptide (TPR) repeat protein
LEPVSPSSATRSTTERFAFGPFVLDPAEWRLTRDGQVVKVPAKALEMLLALVKRPGRLMTKAELLAEVWPGLFVEEGNLTVTMTVLRRALGDEEFIETVPKRGYRFVGPVTVLDGQAAQPAAAPPVVRVRRAIPVWAVVTLVGLLGAVGVGGSYWRSIPAAPSHFVIVAPFTTLASSTNQAYLQVGMAEALTSRLSRLREMRVAPMAALAPSEDVFAGAARLGATAVLTGSVQQDGDRLRVTAQLTDVADGHLIWGDQFNEKAVEIFALQDRIADRIASSLVRGLSTTERNALRQRETESPAAYDYYLRAREQWAARTPDAVRTAILMFNRAIEIDTSFALAYAGLADAYNISRSGIPALKRYPLALAAAEHALAIDDHLAEAQTARAFQHYKFEWKWAEAEARFRRAIELDPTYALARHWYAECLYLQGRYAESVKQYTQALALDPFSAAIQYDLARAHLRLDDIKSARAAIEAGLRVNRDDWTLLQGLSEVLAAEGDVAGSVEMRLRSMLMNGTSVGDVDAARAAYQRGGLAAIDSATIARLVPRAKAGEFLAATRLAQSYGRLGNRAETLAWLEVAIGLREDGAIQLRSHRSFDFLAGDREFEAMVEKVGFAAR